MNMHMHVHADGFHPLVVTLTGRLTVSQPSWWRNTPPSVFFVLFTVSGFAGLIYQSIWSHYIKLFLGHAAFAQTIVLAIFMGGMALGSWLCAKHAHRIANPLMGYAIAEVAIGLLALVFHSVFTSATAFAFNTAIPGIGSAWGVDLFKWSLAALLILPQSVLLGTTFPLMTGGVLRRHPHARGTSLSMLYFTNSLGAAIGVLVCGFVLVARFGLPGTLLTAGMLNISLGLAVWLIARRTGDAAPMPTPSVSAANQGGRTQTEASLAAKWLMLIAFATGVASFVYEIAWIRMLSLVLGSSTHAFELMLSALIFGIAFGAYWIRGRIDRYRHLLLVLGFVLVAKALFALATLPLYDLTFQAMQSVVNSLARTETAYTGFNVLSHLIAMAIMVPSAFFAGMSLPVITTYLLDGDTGEPAIGKVYAWNTVGAIVGVGLAVHVGLGLLGLRNLVIAAAALDAVVALFLLYRTRHALPSFALPASGVAVALVFVATVAMVQFNPLSMASGIFRDGKFYEEDSTKVVFSRDGKSATINVAAHRDGTMSISTNGKTDASLQMRAGATAASDESTMVLLGSLPLAYRPDARHVANIGFGSGLTTHTLLGSPVIESVDSIEIEPAMVEGARLFGPLVARAFNDKRSNIIIDDAKSYFASRQREYDVIISEPSNPWVSGVAGLFSTEFYRDVGRYLRKDGLLVQWIQLYEIDEALVASIMKSLGDHFADYAMFEVAGSEVIILASPTGKVGDISARIFDMPGIASQLRSLGIEKIEDLSRRRVANRNLIDPAVRTFPIAANSDYFPVVDMNAAKARFMGKRARAVGELSTKDSLVVDILEKRPAQPLAAAEVTPASGDAPLRRSHAAVAYRIRDYVIDGPLAQRSAHLPAWQNKSAYFLARMQNCKGIASDQTWQSSLLEIGRILSTYLPPAESAPVWDKLLKQCAADLSDTQRDWLTLYRAASRRDASAIRGVTGRLLPTEMARMPMEQKQFVLKVAMAAEVVEGKAMDAIALWNAHSPSVTPDGDWDMGFRVILGAALKSARAAQAAGR